MSVRLPFHWAILLWLLGASAGIAGAPETSLLRLVGTDAGLCVEVVGLRERWPEFVDSELVRRVRRSAFYEQWLSSPDYQKLRKAQRRLEALVERPAGRFLRDLFGESVVLAIYPAGGHPARGVLLLKASDEQTVRHALEAWSRAEPAETVSLTFAGEAYFQRTRQPQGEREGETQFYWTSGSLLALSDNEGMIRRVIELAVSMADTDRLSESAEYSRAVGSLSPDCAVKVWFNPRAWDDAFRVGNDPSRVLLAAIWRRCESIVAGARLQSGVVFEVVAHYDGSDLPPHWSRFVEAAGGRPRYLHRVPQTALVAFVGRPGLAALGDWISVQFDGRQGNATRQVSRGLLGGLDPFTDVIPELGPDWCAYLVPDESAAAEEIPVGGVMALSLVPEGRDSASERLRSALDAAVHQALGIVAAIHNAGGPERAAIVESEARPQETVRWIEEIGPWQPAGVVGPDALVVGSSPEAATEFLELDSQQSLPSVSGFEDWRIRFFPEENQIAFLNLVAVRDLLQSHRPFFLTHTARSQSQSESEAEEHVGNLQDVLAIADAAFAAAAIDHQRLRIVCGLVTDDAQPAAP